MAYQGFSRETHAYATLLLRWHIATRIGRAPYEFIKLCLTYFEEVLQLDLVAHHFDRAKELAFFAVK